MSEKSRPPCVAEPGMSEESIQKATGKTWDEWFVLLDAWDAASKDHTEVARYVADELGVRDWWAQMLTVGYERARGLRKVHETKQGFVGNASKTVPAPIERLYAAFADEAIRDRWLEPGYLTLRTAQENRSARFDVATGGILELWFTDKGPSKSSVALGQSKLAEADEVAAWKAFWKERFGRLAEELR
jgi:hypothetical protein